VPAGLQQVAELLRLTAPHLQENSGQAEASASTGDSGRGKHLEQDLGEVADQDKAMASSLKEKSPHMQEEPGPLVGGRKHYGRPISELVHEDPAFCQWILRQAEDSTAYENIRAAADWLNANAPHLKELGVLASGVKHRNRPMSEVVVQDPAYCQWILREGQEKEASSELRDMARWLMKNAPHLKDDKLVYASGMHRGRPLQDLVAEDPRYCRWMLRKAEDPTSCNALRQNAAWLGKHAPHLKEPHGHNRGTDMLVRGGKHDGKSMAKVLSEDPWYCRWVLQAAKAGNASLNVEEMAAWLAENAEHLEEDDVCASGHNHHGRPLSELVVHDPSYCHWILRAAQDQDSTPGVQVQAAWLMENAPHLKELPVVHTGAYKGVPLVQVAAEDPRWCRFVMQQPKARSQGFAHSAAWLRKNVPQLLDVREDDDGAINEIRQKFFKRHGKLFVVRFGKHRMKTFQRTVEEAPRYVQWVEKLVAAGGPRTALSVNFELLAAFARQQRSEEHITEKTAPTHLEELRQPLPDALPDAFAHKAAERIAA